MRRTSMDKAVNALIARDEPQFQVMLELEKIELVLALNWYSQNSDKEQSHKFLTKYCLDNGIQAKQEQINAQVSTLGFVARLLSRGAKLDEKSIAWFNTRMKSMVEAIPEVEPQVIKPVVKKDPQDELKQKTTKCISDLEQAVDMFIASDFKDTPNLSQILQMYELKSQQNQEISKFFAKWRDEINTVIACGLKDREAPEMEPYNNYTLFQLRKLEEYYSSILALVNVTTETPTKKPRKKKVKSPEKQVKNIKILQEDKELKIISVPAKDIVGASILWTYHVPSRMLTNYISKDDTGFVVKGCAIMNYDESKSRTKKLRKPEVTLPEVLNSGKVSLRHILDSLTTKDGNVTGRVNSQTLLLRVL